MTDTDNLILFPDFERVKTAVERMRTELSMLVLERDELLHVECKNIEMMYVLELGSLHYQVYELECAILRQRRKMELIQARLNRQQPVHLDEIDAQLDQEMAEYDAKLNEQMKAMNDALSRSQGEALTEEQTRELKQLYRTIVKSLHPDLHPDMTTEQLKLFHHAVTAYEHGDLMTLRIISELVAASELTKDTSDSDVLTELLHEETRLTGLIQAIQVGIQDIKANFPYTMKTLLQSPAQLAERKAELKRYVEQLTATLQQYKDIVNKMMR